MSCLTEREDVTCAQELVVVVKKGPETCRLASRYLKAVHYPLIARDVCFGYVRRDRTAECRHVMKSQRLS